jgi:hypothetical protein
MPTVSGRLAQNASFSLVPTPSVEDTRTGFFISAQFKEKSPPNPPMSLMTPLWNVERTRGLVQIDSGFSVVLTAHINPIPSVKAPVQVFASSTGISASNLF